MAENIEQSPEVVTRREDSGAEPAVRSFIASLQRNERLQALGLTGDVVRMTRAVLCALWRHTPTRELDLIKSALPMDLILMFGSCEAPHRHGYAEPHTFRRDVVVDDVAAHLNIPRDQALTVFGTVFDAMCGLVIEEELEDTCRYVKSPELLEALRCRA